MFPLFHPIENRIQLQIRIKIIRSTLQRQQRRIHSHPSQIRGVISYPPIIGVETMNYTRKPHVTECNDGFLGVGGATVEARRGENGGEGCEVFLEERVRGLGGGWVTVWAVGVDFD